MNSPWRKGLRFGARSAPKQTRPRYSQDLPKESRAGLATGHHTDTALSLNASKRNIGRLNAQMHICGCGRTIRGPSFFIHQKKCPGVAA